jgi:formate C-acetyltransferase
VDAFSLGYKYNFTAIAECGFATAVDSLLAVKEFVYDRKAVSLDELGRILAANWEGHEELRLRMKHSKLKWGCGNPEADALAKEVIEGFTSRFVGKPNGRGGQFVCYGLQSRAFIHQGLSAGATPDGRRKGEFFSKNMAPNVGAETEGITGSIASYGAIAPENFPCGSIYDVMIHPSTVSGEKGLQVFRTLVEQFYAGGGVALNVNVVSSETLRDAQQHPEKYENLQVRVAGWNIRWNDLPRKEQDEYIARIECVGR